MTSSKKWMRYLDPRSLYLDNPPELQGGPPFNFESVTSRVFPINANISRLARFCDQYLNSAGEDPKTKSSVQFRPALPYVYLMVINYGSMSPRAVTAQNLGWVAQREVTFTVPLEQWEKENGRFVFKRWACVSPFIFVDDELSLTTGREVYGWPKAYAHMETQPTLWSQDPRLDSRLFVMKTDIVPMPYAGQQERPLVLMEIDLAPRPTYSEFPPSPKNPWSPISIFSTAAEGSLRVIEDITDMLLGLPIRGYRSDRDPATLVRMTGNLCQGFFRLLPSYLWPTNVRNDTSRNEEDTPSACFLNQITLKQFRDAENPDKACYQAVVSSTMGINRLNACGLLGDLYLLRGDPSGGFTIRLHRYTAQPIIETLGLEFESGEGCSAGDAIEPRGSGRHAPVALIKPTFPFWTDVDLNYGKGEIISWRSDSSDRRTDKGTPFWVNKPRPQAQTSTGADSTKEPNAPATQNTTDPNRTRAPELPDYNTTQGLAVQAVTGPFRFPDITLQVYPLLANRKKLKQYVDGYFTNPLKKAGEAQLKFELFGSYVYMVINVTDRQFGTMWSETNNIGWWADKDVSFCVPVKVYQRKLNEERKLEEPKLITLAAIVPFAYANSSRAVITDREVNGRNVVKALMNCPEDAWLGSRGPASPRKMLEVETEVFPALNVGQKSEMRTLIELLERDPTQDDRTNDRLVGEKWSMRLEEEAVRISRIAKRENCKNAVILALELMTRENPVNFIYLKQYRDAENPDYFCYQAYVNAMRNVHSVLEIQEITQGPIIRLHRYPDHNIRDALGLECRRMDSEGDSVVYELDPIRPFWMRLQVNEELSKVLCSRSYAKGQDDDSWWTDHPWFSAETAERESTPVPWVRKNRKEQEDKPYFGSEFGWTSVGDGVLDAIRNSPTAQQVYGQSIWSEQTKASADTWLRDRLLEEIHAISVRTLVERKARLSQYTRTELGESGWDLDSVAGAKSTEELYWFVEELSYALEGDINSMRFKRSDARTWISKLDDVKALIERALYESESITAARRAAKRDRSL